MDYDTELQLHNTVLRRACDIRRNEHVLDIGCGTGLTTREAARSAAMGRALGVDTSATMLARARELAEAQQLQRLDAAAAERALERLRELFAAHDAGSGVWFDARAWIVTSKQAADLPP